MKDGNHQTRSPRDPAQLNQPPQLRLPLSRTPHRPHLPLLHPHRHRNPTMTFTTKRTGAPIFVRRARGAAFVPGVARTSPLELPHRERDPAMHIAFPGGCPAATRLRPTDVGCVVRLLSVRPAASAHVGSSSAARCPLARRSPRRRDDGDKYGRGDGGAGDTAPTIGGPRPAARRLPVRLPRVQRVLSGASRARYGHSPPDPCSELPVAVIVAQTLPYRFHAPHLETCCSLDRKDKPPSVQRIRADGRSRTRTWDLFLIREAL